MKQEPLKPHEESHISNIKCLHCNGLQEFCMYEDCPLKNQHKDDWNELQQSQVMYSKEESREFELERENERLLVIVDTLKEENKRLRDSLFGHHHSLPNDKNNY